MLDRERLGQPDPQESATIQGGEGVLEVLDVKRLEAAVDASFCHHAEDFQKRGRAGKGKKNSGCRRFCKAAESVDCSTIRASKTSGRITEIEDQVTGSRRVLFFYRAEGAFGVVVGDDVLAQFGADRLKEVAQMADERETAENGVFPLAEVEDGKAENEEGEDGEDDVNGVHSDRRVHADYLSDGRE